MNMPTKLVILSIAVASLIVLSVVIVQAGDFKGSWSANTGSWEGTITYTFEDSDVKRWTDAERGVVRAAIAAWEEKSEGVRWKEVESDADIPFKWDSLDRGTAGKITLKSDQPDGVIFNTDVGGGWYVDPFPATDEVVLFTKMDLLSVAIHEVGHALGLKHSFGEKASMDSWWKGDRQRVTSVDEAALFKFYPEGPYLEFLVRDDLPEATIGQVYPGYSFCDPSPQRGLFCGGPLAANPDTTNPTGGTPNYTFSIDGVGLPFGLTLNFNGNLEGTPKAGTPTGLQPFDVCATDQVGAKKCQQFEINVKDAIAPTITPPTPTSPPPTATPVPPTPAPQPGSVSIQSTSCTFVSRSESTFIGVDEVFDVTISVTITGPVGTSFRVTRDQTAAAGLGFSEYSSSWTGGFNRGRREAGDPETNTWTERFRVHTFNEPGQSRSGTILFTATVTDSYQNRATSQLVTCPWQ